MCNPNMLGTGIGGILGGIAADVLAPEIGIPATIAAAAGSGLGSTVGGLATGEKFGQAALGGLESGATAGLLSGAGTLLSGGDLASPNSFVSDIAGTSTAAGPAGAIGPAGEAGASTLAPTIAGAATPTSAPIAAATGPSAASFGASTTPAATTATAPAALAASGGGGGGGVTATPLAPLTGGGGGVSGSDLMTPLPGSGGQDFAGGGTTADGGLLGGKVGSFIKGNLPQLAALGIGGMELLKGNQPLPGQAALQNAATTAQTNAATDLVYQRTGTLPPGLRSIIDQNTSAAKAALRSNYASLGYSGSTAETQALHQIDEASAGQIAQIANQLAQQGQTWANLSEQEFSKLLDVQTQQEQGFQQALSRFAGGLAGLKTGTSASA